MSLPFAVHSETSLPVIGVLSGGSRESDSLRVSAFLQGLKDIGYIEGQNVSIRYRWTAGRNDQLKALADDLVHQQVTVISTIGGTAAALAAKAVTSTIPVVFTTGGDPIQLGLVTSLNRPSTNMTGVVLLSVELTGKRLELLLELLPEINLFALLTNPANPTSETATQQAQDFAQSHGLLLHVLHAGAPNDIHIAFDAIVAHQAGGLVIDVDSFLTNRTAQIVALAARRRVPTIYGWREPVIAAGLMCYATSLADAYRFVGRYTGLILKGRQSRLTAGSAGDENRTASQSHNRNGTWP
jgi:putative ABC transport system substrate-binding protein